MRLYAVHWNSSEFEGAGPEGFGPPGIELFTDPVRAVEALWEFLEERVDPEITMLTVGEDMRDLMGNEDCDEAWWTSSEDGNGDDDEVWVAGIQTFEVK